MNPFIFDDKKPVYSIQVLILAGMCIIIISQLITISICKISGIDMTADIKEQQDSIVKKWKESGIEFHWIILSEILGTIIYSSLAEEMVYKFLVMKIFLVDTLGLNPYISCIIQGELFSITHYINIITAKQKTKYTILQLISSFVSGIIGGLFYIHFNSLIPCIIAHMINNSLVVINDIQSFLKDKNNNTLSL